MLEKILAEAKGNGSNIPKEILAYYGKPELENLRVEGPGYSQAIQAYSELSSDHLGKTMTYNSFFQLFSESAELISFSERARRFLVFMLESGSKGFKEPIVKFIPDPSPINNYLWFNQKNGFCGIFEDIYGKQYAFNLIHVDGDTWNKQFGPIEIHRDSLLKGLYEPPSDWLQQRFNPDSSDLGFLNS